MQAVQMLLMHEAFDQLKQQVSIQGDIRKWTGNPVDAASRVVLDRLGAGDLVLEYGRLQFRLLGY